MIDQLLTREELAAIFNVSPRTIDAWLRTGELAAPIHRAASSVSRAVKSSAECRPSHS